MRRNRCNLTRKPIGIKLSLEEDRETPKRYAQSDLKRKKSNEGKDCGRAGKAKCYAKGTLKEELTMPS